MVVALKPLHDAAVIKRVVISTYQSVSGLRQGRPGRALEPDQGHLCHGFARPQEVHQTGIAFNVIPHIDVFLDSGDTKEEWKMSALRQKKILDPKIKVTATCVRVPVFVGHSEALNVEFEKPLSADEARDLLREAPGCMVIDKRENGGYVTPVECVGDYATFISRIREDQTIESSLNMWVVSDNLRKGAASNAVQIAEAIINRG